MNYSKENVEMMVHKKKTTAGRILTWSGMICLSLALFLVIYNRLDDYRAKRSADTVLKACEERLEKKEMKEEGSTPDYVLNPDMNMPEVNVDDISCIGVLEIPSISLTLPVSSKYSDEILREIPCRYYGSVYTDNMVIAGHNYISHFGKLSQLTEGDAIIFTDVEGHTFTWYVDAIEALHSTDVEGMTEVEQPLTLFTCTMDGQNRITVRCISP